MLVIDISDVQFVCICFLPTASLLFFVLPQRKVTKENGIPKAFGTNRSARKRSYAACYCGWPDRSSQARSTLLSTYEVIYVH